MLDLSYIQIFPNDFVNKPGDHVQQTNPTANPSGNPIANPFAHTKVLNLTGSVVNLESPMEFLNLTQMPELEILKIGQVCKNWYFIVSLLSSYQVVH